MFQGNELRLYNEVYKWKQKNSYFQLELHWIFFFFFEKLSFTLWRFKIQPKVRRWAKKKCPLESHQTTQFNSIYRAHWTAVWIIFTLLQLYVIVNKFTENSAYKNKYWHSTASTLFHNIMQTWIWLQCCNYIVNQLVDWLKIKSCLSTVLELSSVFLQNKKPKSASRLYRCRCAIHNFQTNNSINKSKDIPIMKILICCMTDMWSFLLRQPISFINDIF